MGIFDADDEDWKSPKDTLEDYCDWQIKLLIYQIINIKEFKENIKNAIKTEREKWNSDKTQ